jgi:hypothetical protein
MISDTGKSRIAWLGALILALVLALSCMPVATVGTELTRNTIRLSLAWYFVALILMMGLPRQERNATTRRGRIARWCWTWGVVCFVLHLVAAFQFFHQWSHAHAFEHTREVSGIGQGIYVSYLFTGLWILDTIWWWCWPQEFATRSIWWDRCLHAFMLFIVFNGTIVFETGMIRFVGATMFVILAAAWVQVLLRRMSGERLVVR